MIRKFDGASASEVSDLLHNIGLAAPDTVELCWKLNESGCTLPLTELNPEECAQALYDWLKA